MKMFPARARPKGLEIQRKGRNKNKTVKGVTIRYGAERVNGFQGAGPLPGFCRLHGGNAVHCWRGHGSGREGSKAQRIRCAFLREVLFRGLFGTRKKSFLKGGLSRNGRGPGFRVEDCRNMRVRQVDFRSVIF